MTTDEALEFLRSHQPMPPELEISQELIDRYDDVRKHFLAYPDPRCVPLFLGSFGEGAGYGVYQLLDAVFRMYAAPYVVEHLLTALNSPHLSVRTWSLQMAMWFPDEKLRLRAEVLADSTDEDEREWAKELLEEIDRAT